MHLAEWLCSVMSNGLNKVERSLSLGGSDWSRPLLVLAPVFLALSLGKGCDGCICLSFLASFFPSWKIKIQKNTHINVRSILVCLLCKIN